MPSRMYLGSSAGYCRTCFPSQAIRQLTEDSCCSPWTSIVLRGKHPVTCMSTRQTHRLNLKRMPPLLREQLKSTPRLPGAGATSFLTPNEIYEGDALELLKRIEPDSVALSIWSPPYFVGKQYESHLTFD